MKDVSTVENDSQRESDEEGEFFNLVAAVIANAGTWQISWQTTTGVSGKTGPIAYNASVAEVQAAVDAIGVGKFVVTELGSQEYRIIWHASFGFFAGLSGSSIDLSGVTEEACEYDVTQYTVPLTRNFIVGGQVPPSSVEPHGGAGGSRPSPRPVSGSRA